MKAQALAVEYLPLAALRPYQRNARTHSPEQVAQIAASMREFGWTNPILIDEAATIIAGHGRLAAARDLGLGEVPVIRLAGLSDEQRRALSLADNKLALNAGWDEQLLGAELQSLGNLQGLVGFSDDELLRLFNRGNPGLTDPDEAPEPPVEPVTQLGDVWRLGPHRLVCGDATKAEDVTRALDGVAPHLMVTDPPWGVEYDPEWRNRAARRSPGMGNRCIGAGAIGRVMNDDRADWSTAWALFPGAVAYVWCPPGTRQIEHHAALVTSGFDVRMQVIWAKSHFPIGQGNYHVQHEPCWYAVRKGATAHWQGDRTQSTLWQIAKPQKSETGHSTQKPVECMRRPIENNSSPGQAVYDPFVGSGTTIIAAEITGRVCHALEIAPAYCDVAVERWQNFTGRKVERIPADAVAA